MRTSRFAQGLCCLALLMLGGCPFAVADPATESRIVNGTTGSRDVELVLDPLRYHLEPSQDPRAYAKGWLQEFAVGEHTEVVELDVDRLTGR